MDTARDMARRFAMLHIAHWREAKAKGLRRRAHEARVDALWWVAAAKGRTK